MATYNLPIRSVSSTSTSSRSTRNQDAVSGHSTPPSSAATSGPARDFAPIADRLIVGVDFGTTFSG